MAVVDVHVHIYPDKIAERRGLPVIIHCRDYRYDYSHPRRLKRVLREFPDLVVDAAHFGVGRSLTTLSSFSRTRSAFSGRVVRASWSRHMVRIACSLVPTSPCGTPERGFLAFARWTSLRRTTRRCASTTPSALWGCRWGSRPVAFAMAVSASTRG